MMCVRRTAVIVEVKVKANIKAKAKVRIQVQVKTCCGHIMLLFKIRKIVLT